METATLPARGELAALLAAVRAAPAEDTPRLVLADWLDERGTARDTRHAAYIRRQIAAPTRVERGKPALRELFPALVAADKNFAGEMSRGTLRLTVSANRFRESQYQNLIRSEDWLWVERVNLESLAPKWLGAVLESPLLLSIRDIGFGIKSLERILGQWKGQVDEYLPHLDAVAFHHGYLRAEGFRRLLEWPRFRTLRRLGLPMQHITDIGIALWGESDSRPALEALDLSRCSLSAAGASVLVRFPELANLQELDLSNNNFASLSEHTLDGAAFTRSLRRLRWRSWGFGGLGSTLDETLRAILAGRDWPALEELDVTGSRSVTDARGYEQLLEPARLPQLHALRSEAHTTFTGKLIAALARNGLLGQLRSLALHAATEEGTLAALARSPEAAGLEVLEIDPFFDGRVAAESWAALARGEVFRSLHRLGIGSTSTFTEATARVLVGSPHFPALEVVMVGSSVPMKVRGVLQSRFAVWAE